MLRPIQTNSPVKTTPEGNNKKSDIPLKQGTLIKGTVIQKLKDGDFIISSGGKNFRAHSAFPLKDNKNYNFIVLSSKSKIELKVLEIDTNAAGNITKLFSSANTVGRRLTDALSVLVNSRTVKNLPSQASNLIVKLQNLVNSPVLKKDITEILPWVNKNIRGSGIFWESKVLQVLTGKKVLMQKEMADTDLKGLLLKLLKNIEKTSVDQEGMKALSMKVREALNHIEQEQIMNLNTMREDLGWFIHLPFINDDDFLSSEFFVKENKEGSLHFSLFLDMRFAGKMNIDVSIIKDTVGIQIDVEKEETKGFITESISELEEAFRNMDINISNIRCEVKEKIIASDTVETDNNSSVDIVI
ncbi:MAG: flagellar hook-length control protein FliK [Desulfobacteraceae bacterium]|jgi:hypothetical protein